jgi:hypothetical protein
MRRASSHAANRLVSTSGEQVTRTNARSSPEVGGG